MSLLPPPHTLFLSFFFSSFLLFFFSFFFSFAPRGAPWVPIFPLALADGKLATRLTSTCTGQPSRGVWILVSKQVLGCPWRWTAASGHVAPGPGESLALTFHSQPPGFVAGQHRTLQEGSVVSPTSILGRSAGISPPVHGPLFAGSPESWHRKSFRYNTYSPLTAFLSIVACVSEPPVEENTELY